MATRTKKSPKRQTNSRVVKLPDARKIKLDAKFSDYKVIYAGNTKSDGQRLLATVHSFKRQRYLRIGWWWKGPLALEIGKGVQFPLANSFILDLQFIISNAEELLTDPEFER